MCYHILSGIVVGTLPSRRGWGYRCLVRESLGRSSQGGIYSVRMAPFTAHHQGTCLIISGHRNILYQMGEGSLLAAVLVVATPCAPPPQTAAEHRPTFLSLCVSTPLNHPIAFLQLSNNISFARSRVCRPWQKVKLRQNNL